MPTVTPFLTFVDQAEEAAALYVSIVPRSKITQVTRYPAGGPRPEGSVMTVSFELDGLPVVALNGGESFKFSNAFSLTVTCTTQAEVDDLTDKLIAGGGHEVACGWVHDRFGLAWQVTPAILPELLVGTDRARVERVMHAMMQMTRIDIAALHRAAAAG
jgi:predicted 3-demethylubiquinone-9 3-methyltransferase (glyoxalase superfamily)